MGPECARTQAHARWSLDADLDAMAKSPDHRQYDDGEDNKAHDRRVRHCVRFLVITLEPCQRGARLVGIGRLDFLEDLQRLLEPRDGLATFASLDQ